MDNEFNSLLESVGIDTNSLQWSHAAQRAAQRVRNRRMTTIASDTTASQEPEDCPAPEPEPTSELAPQSLSDDDFNDILQENGVELEEDTPDVQDVDFEEHEEERDLDAEEDEDWEEAIREGRITPVSSSTEESVYTSGGILSQMERTRQEIDEMLNSAINVVSVGEDGSVTIQGPDGENVVVSHAEFAHNDASTIISTGVTVEEENTPPAPQQQSDEEIIREGRIPQNSPTLLMDESTTRFSGAEWFTEIQKQRIIVAGQGGIGSWLTLQLARMTPAAIFLYDDDTVETVNMAGQLYSRDDVGRYKVDAIADMITKYTNIQNVHSIRDRFTEETEAGDVMMCGFDNMVARRAFFDAWQKHVYSKPEEEWHNCLFLDGRLSMTELQILCVTGDNAYAMTEYRDRYLFDDSEAEHTVCSMKQTTYLACMIGSLMTNLFTNFVANQLEPIIPYDLPFFTSYDAQNMIFKTEN